MDRYSPHRSERRCTSAVVGNGHTHECFCDLEFGVGDETKVERVVRIATTDCGFISRDQLEHAEAT